MNSYRLLFSIHKLAKKHNWQVFERKGSTTHLVLRLDKRRDSYRAIIPMHRGKDLHPKTYYAILKNLGIKENQL